MIIMHDCNDDADCGDADCDNDIDTNCDYDDIYIMKIQ